MPTNFTLHALMPLTLGVVSLSFIAMGLYALIRRRPFVMRAGWMLAVIVVTMSPSVFLQLSQFLAEDRYRSGGLDLMSILSALTTVILICFIALQTRGYMVFGTTQDSFRDAPISALSHLRLTHEETQASIRLPSVPAELQVAVQGWIGTGQLRLRNGGRPGLLGDIADGMSTYFNSTQVKMNMTTAVVDLVLGILIGAMVVTLIFVVR